MKTRHYITFLFLAAVLFYSCSAPYQVSTNVKLKYTWAMTGITLNGDVAGAALTAPVFEDATIDCLKGSKWAFNEEGSGTYTINSADTANCLKGIRKFNWEVVTLKGKSHYLQFYRYNAPKGILADRFTPYIAEISELSKTSMVLKYPVKYHGLTGSIIFTLTKQ